MTGFRFLYPPEWDPAQEVRMKSFDFDTGKIFFNGSECVAVSAGDCGRSCRTSDAI